jgi:hypothetical protein
VGPTISGSGLRGCSGYEAHRGTRRQVDSGSNLTPETFFGVRFTGSGSNTSAVVLNWQRGLAASHDVSIGTASGDWTISAVRAPKKSLNHVVATSISVFMRR